MNPEEIIHNVLNNITDYTTWLAPVFFFPIFTLQTTNLLKSAPIQKTILALFFQFTSNLLLAQTTVKEKDYTLKYSITNKIGIQFDDTTTDIKAFDTFTNNEFTIEKDDSAPSI